MEEVAGGRGQMSSKNGFKWKAISTKNGTRKTPHLFVRISYDQNGNRMYNRCLTCNKAVRKVERPDENRVEVDLPDDCDV